MEILRDLTRGFYSRKGAEPSMGWIQRLCEVYDVVSGVDMPEEIHHTQLVRVGFTKKKINYLVRITAAGTFSRVIELDKDDCDCIVPTTPEAEGRTGANGAPRCV